VKHRASPRFWRCCRGLPKEVQSLADKNYALLKANPSHPSLHPKKVAEPISLACGAGLNGPADAAPRGPRNVQVKPVLKPSSAL